MDKIKELDQRNSDLKAEGLALVAAAEEEDRGLTEDEISRLDAIEAEVAKNEKKAAELRDLAERRRSMDAVPAGGASGGGRQGGVTRVGADRAQQDPRCAFADMGDFVTSVVHAVSAQQHGGQIDPRLLPLAATHQGGGSSGEGYNLPPAFRDEVWVAVETYDELGPMIDEEPTSAREVKLTADETTPWGTSGITAYWRGEGNQMTESNLADEGRSVPLHELYVLATATEELLEDAPRLNNRLTTKAAQAIAWKKNDAIVNGNGVGRPMGWFPSAALVTVAKESGQSADTIVAANVAKMFARLQRIPGDRPFWMANQDTLPQLMTMTLGDQPIWSPPNGFVDAPGGILLGAPVRLSDHAKTLGDKGDLQLISPKGYYGVRRSQGVQFATSIHLYFDYNKQAFRWVFRYGGQPHLSAPISPNNGTATRSHFVTLAERA